MDNEEAVQILRAATWRRTGHSNHTIEASSPELTMEVMKAFFGETALGVVPAMPHHDIPSANRCLIEGKENLRRLAEAGVNFSGCSEYLASPIRR